MRQRVCTQAEAQQLLESLRELWRSTPGFRAKTIEPPVVMTPTLQDRVTAIVNQYKCCDPDCEGWFHTPADRRYHEMATGHN